MKEYKVLSPALGFRKKSQTFEDILNTHAREGWAVKSIITNNHGGITYIIFERDKNRWHEQGTTENESASRAIRCDSGNPNSISPSIIDYLHIHHVYRYARNDSLNF